MKTRNFIAICCMLMITTSASAQKEAGEFSFIPRIGMTLANMSGMDFYYDGVEDREAKSKMKVGVTAGIDVEYQALPALGISLGAHYSLQGCRFSKTFAFNAFNTNIHYLNFPLMANLYVGSGFALRAGVQMGVKLDEDATNDGFGQRDLFKSVDVSIPFGISYEYKNFILGARYNLGATNISKFKEWKNKNEVFVIDLGFRI
ncbi:MAG: PorT family protein [Prevotella sp.]|nr:PorT family protein [Prevotella sp.]